MNTEFFLLLDKSDDTVRFGYYSHITHKYKVCKSSTYYKNELPRYIISRKDIQRCVHYFTQPNEYPYAKLIPVAKFKSFCKTHKSFSSLQNPLKAKEKAHKARAKALKNSQYGVIVHTLQLALNDCKQKMSSPDMINELINKVANHIFDALVITNNLKTQLLLKHNRKCTQNYFILDDINSILHDAYATVCSHNDENTPICIKTNLTDVLNLTKLLHLN